MHCHLHLLLMFTVTTGSYSGGQLLTISSPCMIANINKLLSQKDYQERRQLCCNTSEHAQQRLWLRDSRWPWTCAVVAYVQCYLMCCPEHASERTTLFSAVRKLAAPHTTPDRTIFPRGHWILRREVSHYPAVCICESHFDGQCTEYDYSTQVVKGNVSSQRISKKLPDKRGTAVLWQESRLKIGQKHVTELLDIKNTMAAHEVATKSWTATLQRERGFFFFFSFARLKNHQCSNIYPTSPEAPFPPKSTLTVQTTTEKLTLLSDASNKLVAGGSLADLLSCRTSLQHDARSTKLNLQAIP